MTRYPVLVNPIQHFNELIQSFWFLLTSRCFNESIQSI